VQQQRVQQRQLAWHQQRELQVRLAQQLVQEQQRAQVPQARPAHWQPESPVQVSREQVWQSVRSW
jgi:hypothetical protein